METLPALQEHSVELLISQAIDKQLPVETMERLLAMRRELKAEYAKEQFITAISQFQSECPIIVKTKEVRGASGLLYKYAPLDSIVAQVKELLTKYGLSYRLQTETQEKSAKATCIITHVFGHSEESAMQLPLITKTNAMSEAQVLEGTLTICKRLAFCNALGILTSDEDLNGPPRVNVHFTPTLETIYKLLPQAKRITKELICKRCDVNDLTELTTEQINKVITALQKDI